MVDVVIKTGLFQPAVCEFGVSLNAIIFLQVTKHVHAVPVQTTLGFQILDSVVIVVVCCGMCMPH